MQEEAKTPWKNFLIGLNLSISAVLLLLYSDGHLLNGGDSGLTNSSNLEQRFSSLENSNAQAQEQILNLQSDLFNLRWFPQLKSSASFLPNSEGFEVIETSVGNVFVSLDKIEPYANGHKVTFNVGNPYAADILSVSTEVSYGLPYEEYKKKLSEDEVKAGKGSFEEWNKTLHTAKKDLMSGLSPRSWNRVTFILTPSKPEDVGLIKLKVEANGISLLQPRT